MSYKPDIGWQLLIVDIFVFVTVYADDTQINNYYYTGILNDTVAMYIISVA